MNAQFSFVIETLTRGPPLDVNCSRPLHRGQEHGQEKRYVQSKVDAGKDSEFGAGSNVQNSKTPVLRGVVDANPS